LSAFEEGGFAGPFRAFEAHEMRAFRDALDAHVFTCDGPDPRSRYQSRHLDSERVLQICRGAPIVSCVREVLGANAVLWRSNFFPKPPGAQEFDWHTDRSHWRDLLDPMVNLTAWLAIDPATSEGGCLEFKYGSNPAGDAVTIPLDAGEFVLFDQDTPHRSGPNATPQPRLGLAIRFTLAHVRIKADGRLAAGHRTIALSGAGA